MAEVKLSMIKKHTVSYIDNGALITAKIAPPSLTYLDPQSRVTISKDPVIIVTYNEGIDVELEAPLQRDIENTVELSGRIERVVDSYDPFKYSIEGDLKREISNSVELDYQLQRNVLSFNVGLEYGIRRVVTNDVEIEGNLSRTVKSKIDLEGNLCRIIESDEADDPGVPEKDYKSFIDQNKLFRVQHDILDEDVSDNPYFAKEISNLQNAALLTKNQTVIKAINELVINQKELFLTVYNHAEKLNNDLGDMITDSDLRVRFNQLGYDNIREAVISLSNNIDLIVKFIGSQSEELDAYNDLQYKNLIDGLIQLNEKLKELSYQWDDWNEEEVEWIFKTKDYIADIRDTVIDMLNAMDDEIRSFEQRVSDRFIVFANDTENQMTRYYQSFLDIFNDCEDITEERIRKIFYYLLDEETMQESEDPVVQLVVSLATDLAEYKMTVTGALTSLSDDFYDFSNITEEEIRAIFSHSGSESEEESFETTVINYLNHLDTGLNDLADLHQQDIIEIKENLIANLDNRINVLSSKHDEDINTINSSISNVNYLITNLTNRYDTDITNLSDQVFNNTTQINIISSDLNDQIALHNDDIAAINETLTTHTNQLQSLTNSFNFLIDTHVEDCNLIAETLVDISSAVSQLQQTHISDMDIINNSIDTLRNEHIQDIQSITYNIQTIESEISDLNSYTVSINNTLSTLNDTYSTDITSIRSRLDAQEEALTTLSETHVLDITNLRNEIDNDIRTALEDFQEFYESDISVIQASISNITSAVDDLTYQHQQDMIEIREEISQNQSSYDDLVTLVNDLQSELSEYKLATDERLDNLESTTETHTTSIEDLDNRVSMLEIASMFPSHLTGTLTVGDVRGSKIVSESEIEGLFTDEPTMDDTQYNYSDTIDPDTPDSENAVVSEEDIRSLFNNT